MADLTPDDLTARSLSPVLAYLKRLRQALRERDAALADVAKLREALGQTIDWFGVPEWPPPPMPEELGRLIATAMADTEEAKSDG